MRYFICCFILLYGGLREAAAQSQPTLRDLMATPIQVRGADCALFPAIASFDTLDYHVARIAPYRFTPTRQQVDTVETQLAKKGLAVIAKPALPLDSMLAFIRSNVTLSYIHTHLPGYKRQYIGFYNTQRQRCLSVQFIGDPGDSWLYQRMMIMDGGPSVWEVCYNLETGVFYFFGVNGLG